MSDYELVCQREPTVKLTTFGKLFRPTIDGPTLECYTLEDVVREILDQPVESWKLKGRTAIPAGRYRVTMETSPKFGPDTITLNDVPGYVGVRVHSGNDESDTEGCPLVGTAIERDPDGDGGNLLNSRAALLRLKQRIIDAISRGDTVYWEARNP